MGRRTWPARRSTPRPIAVAVLTGWLTGCLLLAGCGSPPARPSPEPNPTPSRSPAVVAELPGWARVGLPGDFVPSTLATEDARLWIGGLATGTRAPRIAVAEVGAESAARPLPPRSVPLRPVSPYAADAEIVSLAVRQGRVAALGGVRDGAHANVRWSVWRGDARGIREYPQGFNTFGGPQAGDLVDVVAPASDPVVVGTWSSAHGLDGAVWLAAGEKWVRQPSAGTALASTSRELVSIRSALAERDRVVAVGSVTVLGTKIGQRAAVWTWGSRRQPWTVEQLPADGRLAEALTASCSATGCDAYGHVDGRLAGWHLSGAGDEPVPVPLPDTGLDTDPGADAAGTSAGELLAFSTEGRGRLLVRTRSGTKLYATPPGSAGEVAVLGTRLYLITAEEGRRSLWTVDLTDALG